MSKTAIQQFLNQYDINNNLGFDDIKYRQGAAITSSFGLTDGYRKENGKYIWDTARIHTGVDRNAPKGIRNIVYASFNFDRSEIHDYGADHIYGSLIRLFNEQCGFEMRIVHMNPSKDIEQEALTLLVRGKSIPRNTILGRAGTYGSASSGKHTHTEVISLDEINIMLEVILYRKFGQDVYNNYTNEYIYNFYKTKQHWKNKGNQEIFTHFNELLNERKVDKRKVYNKFKYSYKDWFYDWQIKTRYSTELLFNGL